MLFSFNFYDKTLKDNNNFKMFQYYSVYIRPFFDMNEKNYNFLLNK